MDKLIGTMLDNRYEVLEVIGTGGMAIVYKAKCHRLNRYVAIKVMKEEYAKDEEFRRRFFEESRAVAMLSHPNIVNVFDVSRSGDVDYIVMELIDGITLKEYLSRRGALSWKETTFFATQIAKALEHAHSRGIIHRDIKPQNIMLLKDGTVKVADFGIAHRDSSNIDYAKGEAIGSVHYVSPEQAKGSYIDNRSDLYSFGVVMYEMLTGRLPFEGNTPMEIAIQHINSIPLPPSDYVSGIPQALEAITMKAMNPSPSKRYSSATEMIADLERFKNDPTITIEIESPIIMPEEKDVDATIKISNPGEVSSMHSNARHIDDEDEDEENDDDVKVAGKGKKKKSAFSGAILFAAVSVLIFLAGAVFFVFKVINPFGTGEEKFPVPKFEGMPYEEIENDEDGKYSSFHIEVSEEIYDDEVAKGHVISQSPEEGKNVTQGTEVRLVVSLGPKTVTVDEYKGMDGRSVLIILERLGLSVVPEYVYSEDVEAGLVISTSPEKDTVMNSGDKITVNISKGKEVVMTTVPELVNKSEEDAVAAIKAAKLEVGKIEKIESPDGIPGHVLFQSLPSGSSAEEGSIIDLHICKAPETVPEPDVTNPEPAPEDEVTIQYVVEIDNIEGDIQIMVAVDSKVAYTANHNMDEGTVIVELTAEEGPHSITVFQNGRLTKEENVAFK